jgi:hypothetical protein
LKNSKNVSFSLSSMFRALISCLIYLGGIGHLLAKCLDFSQLKHFSLEKYLANLEVFFLHFFGKFFNRFIKFSFLVTIVIYMEQTFS